MLFVKASTWLDQEVAKSLDKLNKAWDEGRAMD